jgi:hypothetical protein
MKTNRVLLSVAIALGLTPCAAQQFGPLEIARRPGPAPRAATSKYFKTAGAGFNIRLNEQRTAVRSCAYGLTLTPRRPITSALYLRTRFENPSAKSEPLIVDTDVSPGEPTIIIKSPEVRGLQGGKKYQVEVLVFDSPERSRQLGVHIQFVQSLATFR